MTRPGDSVQYPGELTYMHYNNIIICNTIYPLGIWFSSLIIFASITGLKSEKNSANSFAVVCNTKINNACQTG